MIQIAFTIIPSTHTPHTPHITLGCIIFVSTMLLSTSISNTHFWNNLRLIKKAFSGSFIVYLRSECKGRKKRMSIQREQWQCRHWTLTMPIITWNQNAKKNRRNFSHKHKIQWKNFQMDNTVDKDRQLGKRFFFAVQSLHRVPC